MRLLFISMFIVAELVLVGVSSFAIEGITRKSTVQKNQEGINEAYLGCLMFSSDNNPVQKCSDQRWGSEQALYNKMKTPLNVTIEDLRKATPPNTGQE